MNLFFRKFKQIALLLAIAIFCISCTKVSATTDHPWKLLSLNTEATFADVAFTADRQHGWLVGTKETIFETFDGGENWNQKILELGEEKVNFTAVSFKDKEGWITGKPSLLLHTEDGGENWTRIALSSKLPGSPYSILALDRNTAEMVTDLGAIYKTTDGGKSWKALVEGAVGVARNIDRSQDGKYVAVSANGNFYSTWQPGDTQWTPHNRNSSRRLQNMGYEEDGRMWLLARGGQLQFSDSTDMEKWSKNISPEDRSSWGLLDLASRTPEEMWVVGGSGTLLRSTNQGLTWEKDLEVENVPSNLLNIIFLNPNQGFILGERGVLLKYEPQTEPI
jgi:photosystem II stability/assembly factor-like uncharacterized protein